MSLLCVLYFFNKETVNQMLIKYFLMLSGIRFWFGIKFTHSKLTLEERFAEVHSTDQ